MFVKLASFRWQRTFLLVLSPCFHSKHGCFGPRKRVLSLQVLIGIFVDIYKKMLYFPFWSSWDRILSVSFILFHNRTCRLLKTPRFRILRRSSSLPLEIFFKTENSVEESSLFQTTAELPLSPSPRQPWPAAAAWPTCLFTWALWPCSFGGLNIGLFMPVC